MERVDPQVEAHAARQAGEHQRAVVGALDDERLALVAERLTGESGAEAQARLAVVNEEIARRRRH